MRFALMDAKMALAHAVLNFDISLKPGFQLEVAGANFQTVRPSKNGIHLIFNSVN